MSVRLIIPPAPIVLPSAIPGDHAADDDDVASMIAAAQEDIDGPTGWLGRALGEQTLEMECDGRPCKLPYQPLIEVVSVTVEGEAAALPTWRSDGSLAWPDDAPRGRTVIRYRAGYDGTPLEDGGTGKVPERARRAIILMSKNMIDMVDRDVFQTQESVVGVGSTARNVTPYVSQAVREAVENMLFRLRVWS